MQSYVTRGERGNQAYSNKEVTRNSTERNMPRKEKIMSVRKKGKRRKIYTVLFLLCHPRNSITQ
jgi:hypothetical protein